MVQLAIASHQHIVPALVHTTFCNSSHTPHSVAAKDTLHCTFLSERNAVHVLVPQAWQPVTPVA